MGIYRYNRSIEYDNQINKEMLFISNESMIFLLQNLDHRKTISGISSSSSKALIVTKSFIAFFELCFNPIKKVNTKTKAKSK